ncbi:hypothetical protein EYB53_019985 [Candidatus Chloroploca sp. M-50]|uniref:Uncharacterized protein n=1 Tax=Candidatus Chloroploca mongolica TaxID=2528176 RepID=A0ABS4DEZ1_9CHLR|nr:hypothetical protein [Candidatus Chloroploca mongolica]
MDTEPKDLSLSQLDTILAYLPIFERPGYLFGERQITRGVFPYWAASPEATAFVEALYRERFITLFDWGSWATEAQRCTEGGSEALSTANLTTFRKLITSYVRTDRFSESTLTSLFQPGQFTVMLRRLRHYLRSVRGRAA